MIIPEYWAEARVQGRHRGRRLAVRRFGWSDESPQAAQAHAQARADAALDAILAGQDLPRRERRLRYGVEGVPIREEIVARHGQNVVTRNGYGALCLNTPDVLFADVDFESAPSGMVLPFWLYLALLTGGFALGMWLWNWKVGVVVACVAAFAANAAALFLRRRALAKSGGPQARALARVEAFSARHPEWHLRLYRTFAGLRVLVMHRTFAPSDEAAAEFFRALRADGLYATMCKVQQCFRARLTPKPWRIGIGRHIKPVKAVWSSEQAKRPDRLGWIADYERRAQGFASCRYLRSFGEAARVHPSAERVRALHDDMARAEADLPLA